ncbi:expressed protein [Chlorella variabilis]|uniref:Expressed protein n=1 Tax=Chlorella variabilis TaxID=554065 RepID=E1ZN28_CHLVA|nr:expressed protein [Chlorella variabilis]EFN52797.1 expressed protein [Chlorella variabilis]|eukprot:XP_005844899.1 expressed protein [Chlorella variabilis]
MAALPPLALRREGPGLSINDLTDDLLSAVLAAVRDSTQLRAVASTCRRWAALLRDRLELWHEVQLALPPKRSRGRDRRNSYTTPCALDVERVVGWLARRATAVASLEVALLYPDAEALLGLLVPSLADGLRRLVLRGTCSDWPFFWVDWRWLAGMTQLDSLEMWNALPGLTELALPPSLTELVIDRVGEADPDTEGWDELPDCFTRLTRLCKLTLGTAATYLLQADEESAFTPLRAASGLRELRLTEGALSAVPDALTALTSLTLLSFRGCDRLEAFGEMCQHKADPFAPLAALTALRFLDFARCALERLPPRLASLPQLRTLLLSDNQLTSLPAPPLQPSAAAAAAGAPGPGSVSSPSHRRHQQQLQQQLVASRAAGAATAAAAAAAQAAMLPPLLEKLVLAGNRFASLPAAALAACSCLTELDLARCWQLQPTPAEWRGLLAGLPRLRLLRHSCPLLAAEERGYGSSARLAAAAGGSVDLQLDFLSSSGRCYRPVVHAGGGGDGSGASTSAGGGGGVLAGGGRRVQSCGSNLLELETAAAALLSAGMSAGMRATLAELAATASDGGAAGGGLRAPPSSNVAGGTGSG